MVCLTLHSLIKLCVLHAVWIVGVKSQTLTRLGTLFNFVDYAIMLCVSREVNSENIKSTSHKNLTLSCLKNHKFHFYIICQFLSASSFIRLLLA